MASVKGKNDRFVLKNLRIAIVVLCTLGFLLSYYAFHVETTKEKDRNYKAMCDISEHMSCSAVFTSRYGKGFGLLSHVIGEKSKINQPNSVYGMVFYLLFTTLGQSSSIGLTWLHIGLAVLSNISSIYLAYILYFILYDFCIVCVSTYVINAGLLACSIYKLKYLNKIYGKKKA